MRKKKGKQFKDLQIPTSENCASKTSFAVPHSIVCVTIKQDKGSGINLVHYAFIIFIDGTTENLKVKNHHNKKRMYLREKRVFDELRNVSELFNSRN